jgi:predicted ATPase
MIRRLWVKNYRSLADVEVNLEPLTVLVGPNGSGKSNLVDVLRFIHDALRHGLDMAVVNRHGMGAIRRWSAKGRPYDVEIGVGIEVNGTFGTYTFTLGSEHRGEYSVKKESCFIQGGNSSDQAVFETHNGNWVRKPEGLTPPIQARTLILPLIATTPPFEQIYNFLTSMGFYNIFPNALAEPQKPDNPYPLNEYGTNLASTLQGLQREKSPKLPQLKLAIQTVMPDVVDFQVTQIGGYLITRLHHIISEEGERAIFELSQEADGTLRMIGILVALYQDPPCSLLALEEPELTIHPGALRLLWEEMEEAANTSQIIITTHSPDLLDMCYAEQLRIIEKIDGVTYINPIDEIQKQAIQERLFAPGELLRAQGLHRATQEQLAM